MGFHASVKCAAVAGIVLSGLSARAEAAMLDKVNNTLDSLYSQALDFVPEGVYGVRLGFGPAVEPKFRGDSKLDIYPAPLISLRYKNLLAVDNNTLRINVLGNWGKVAGDSHWSLGPVVRIDGGRDESDSPKLRGLGDVGTGIELGGYVSYKTGPTRLRARIRKDVAGGHGGVLVDFDATTALYNATSWSLSGNVQITWANGKYMSAFYGVTPAQSAASGLPVYHAGSGIHDINASLVASYQIDERWSLLGNLGFSRLLSSASGNPLVKLRGSPNQPNLAVFAVYSFW
jgi:outer membrane scaffolding protein for murein synthesis (MipA/OmpV family)